MRKKMSLLLLATLVGGFAFAQQKAAKSTTGTSVKSQKAKVVLATEKTNHSDLEVSLGPKEETKGTTNIDPTLSKALLRQVTSDKAKLEAQAKQKAEKN